MGWLTAHFRRERTPEIMDEPGLDPAAHRAALADLARINRVSLSAAILWPPLCRLARRHPGKTLRVLDVATGGGDVPVELWRRAERAGLDVRLFGCDISPTALDVARANAAKGGAAVKFFRHDVLKAALPGRYDAVACSLFLHHLSADEAAAVLARMAACSDGSVLVNDLDRSALGYALAWLGTRALSRSPVVRFDGPVSVRSAFTPREARALAVRAGLKGVRVGRRWPFRFLLDGRAA